MFKFLLLLLITPCFSFAQYDTLQYKKDEPKLQEFWDKFAEAINKKDKQQLKNLIHFPFNCSLCLKNEKKNYIKVTKKNFDKEYYNVFFEEVLINAVNKYKAGDNGISKLKENNYYNFRYIVIKGPPGLQGIFDLRKIKGHFKITAVWTLP